MEQREFIEETKKYQGTHDIVRLAKKDFPFGTTFDYIIAHIRREKELKKSELRKQRPQEPHPFP